jgi:chromosome segregation ATPase
MFALASKLLCACRLKEEHTAKLKPLQELNESLLDELSAKRHDASRLAALQDELAHAAHRLELEASGRQELWQRVCCLEQERDATQDKLATATKQLKRAEQQLGESHAARLAHTCRHPSSTHSDCTPGVVSDGCCV